MAPIAALLLEKGLTLLGNAVLAKGEEVIEKELGIKLNEKEIAENTLKYKQLEFDHEEFLLKISLEKENLLFEDTAKARNLGIELSKSTSFLNQNIMPVLALITVFGGTSILLYSEQSEVRMAAVSMMTMVLGYFFGSSHGSKTNSEFIRSMVK